MKKRLLKLLALTLSNVLLFTQLAVTLSVSAEDVGDYSGITFTEDTQYHTEQNLIDYPLTFEARIKCASTLSTAAVGAIVGNGGDKVYPVTDNVNLTIEAGGNPRLYFRENGVTHNYLFTDVNVCVDNWLHLTIVRDPETQEVRCYVDGVLAQTLSAVGGIKSVEYEYPLNLGCDYSDGYGNSFKGYINSVSLYSDVRTGEEIAADAGVSGFDSDNVIAAYDLSAVENNTITDITGNGYNLIGDPLWLTENELDEYAYTFAVVPDTQTVSISDKNEDTAYMAKLYDYIVDNIETQNIKAVLGLGDVTEVDADDEWAVATENFAKLDAKEIPYVLNRGNHDSTAKMTTALANTKYMSQVSGSYNGSVTNTYIKFTVGEVNYLIFALDYFPSDEVLEWAGGIADAHSDHNVIVTTHSILHESGGWHPSHATTPINEPTYNNGQQIWEKFLCKHPNIVLALCGHAPTDFIVRRTDIGDTGNEVVTMLLDMQSREKEQIMGMVGLFHFSEDGRTVQVEYYSTAQEKYFLTQNQFTFTLADPADAIVAPEMNNEYNLAADLNTDFGNKTIKGLGATYNINNYEYLEFDLYVESDTYSNALVQVLFADPNNAARRTNFTIPTNQWVHKCIKISDMGDYSCDETNITKFGIEICYETDTGSKNNISTLYLRNAALTNFAPVMNNEYNLAADLNTDFDSKTIKGLGTTYNINNYDYVEFDLYVESDTYSNARVQVLFADPSNGARRNSFTVPTNQWVHKVIQISGMGDYTCDETNITKFGIEVCYETDTGSKNNISTLYLRNAALTNFSPEMNNEYTLAAELNTNIDGAAIWTLGTTYNINDYDYVEFDLYVESETYNNAKVQVLFGDPQNGARRSNFEIATNQWVHKVIKVSEMSDYACDETNVTKFGVEYCRETETGSNNNISTVYLRNAALTNFAPEADYTYYLGKELSYELDHTYSGDAWATYKTIGETVSFSNYDYLEMDVYVESTTATEQKIRLHPSKDKTDRSHYDVTVATNQWVHLAIPMSSFISMTTAGGLTDTAYFMIGAEFIVKGDIYHIANLALTNAEEPAAVTWGDATGDGSVDIRDLVRMKKLAVYAEGYEDYDIEDYKYADLDEDGMIDAPDLVIMRQYLLGIITSLDPTA